MQAETIAMDRGSWRKIAAGQCPPGTGGTKPKCKIAQVNCNQDKMIDACRMGAFNTDALQ